MGDSQRQTTTLLDAIVDSLVHAARFTPEDQVAPTVILGTDNDRQWEPLVPRLQERLPELWVLGDYDTRRDGASEPSQRSGSTGTSGRGFAGYTRTSTSAKARGRAETGRTFGCTRTATGSSCRGNTESTQHGQKNYPVRTMPCGVPQVELGPSRATGFM